MGMKKNIEMSSFSMKLQYLRKIKATARDIIDASRRKSIEKDILPITFFFPSRYLCVFREFVRIS